MSSCLQIWYKLYGLNHRIQGSGYLRNLFYIRSIIYSLSRSVLQEFFLIFYLQFVLKRNANKQELKQVDLSSRPLLLIKNGLTKLLLMRLCLLCPWVMVLIFHRLVKKVHHGQRADSCLCFQWINYFKNVSKLWQHSLHEWKLWSNSIIQVFN